ncbi:MAG: DUF2520 domain-containing protein [Chloroflexota bacterium]|nr:DUF2520 domain-containing protein [Chloroflexota bacterium]
MLDVQQSSVALKDLPGPVGFVGGGKVGTALAGLLHQHGISVAGVSGRTVEAGRRMALEAGLDARTAGDLTSTVSRSAIVFLTVPDDAIEPLCLEIAALGAWHPGQGVVHCSGALPSAILASASKAGALVASFHPLQAFASLQAAVQHIPGSTFGLEGDDALVSQLTLLVRLLRGTALRLTPGEKEVYHASAVIASNYMVSLAQIASDLLVRSGIAPSRDDALRYLMPLIRGTVDNLDTLGLPTALTGPVSRGDVGTVARHLEALGKWPEPAHMYRHLARMTLPLAAEKDGGTHVGRLEALRALLERSDQEEE